MDIFSFLIPRPVYINSLPSMSFLSISLDVLIYLLAGLLIVTLLIKTDKKIISSIFFGGIMFLSLLYFFQSIIQVYTENTLFWGKTLDELREMTTSNNFYSFVQFADKLIPNNAPVSLDLPKDSTYFAQKAQYFLYPHPIIENASYILVFNKEINPAKNLELLAKFKDKAYVLKKN